jgi:hypothetical protein
MTHSTCEVTWNDDIYPADARALLLPETCRMYLGISSPVATQLERRSIENENEVGSECELEPRSNLMRTGNVFIDMQSTVENASFETMELGRTNISPSPVNATIV